MPIISTFFDIMMYYDEHTLPHLHAEHQEKKTVFDFFGNIIKGNLGSSTATKLIRKWIAFTFPILRKIGN